MSNNSSTRPTTFRSGLLALLGLAILLGLAACGGGGSHAASTTVQPFSMAIPALSLEIGQNGTRTVTITRQSTFTDAVALTVVASSLPAGVKATLASSTVSATGTTSELTIQAGYPDPNDLTDATMILPAAGTYSITVKGVGGTTTATATLALTITSETKTFALAWVDSSNSLDANTTISLAKGASTTLNFAPYNSNYYVSYASGTAATLATQGLPTGLTVTFGDNPATLDYVTTVKLASASTLADGTYTFYIKGTVGSTSHYLPVQVDVTSSAFWIQAPSAVSVAKGSTLTIPVSLGHNGTYFQDNGGTDPDYLGTTALTVGTVTGLTAAFDTPLPRALASANLTIDASSASVGTYTLPLVATRNDQTTTATSTASLTVNVTSASATGTCWLQNLEWGQTVLKPGLRLIPGKQALLVAQILADRAGVTAPSFTATLKNSSGTTLATLALSGPSTIPTSVTEGDLASAYTVAVPAADIVSGMTVALSGGTLSTTLTPAVEDSGYQFNLVLVPIVHQSVAPVLPSTTSIASNLEAVWPVKSVATTQRAAYTTSTVIATPPNTGSTAVDYSDDGWSEVLDELIALKAVDGSTASYYGFIDLSLPSTFSGSSIVGLSLLGDGVGMGIDETTGALFGTGSDLVTMVHELGHGFNLKHAPGGGAADCQMNFPYYGGGIGTWGYDPATATAYSPATYFDIMNYDSTLWVSDWNYTAALNFIDSVGTLGTGTVTAAEVASTTSTTTSDSRLLVSGWMAPDGTLHLSPTEHVRNQILPRTGTHQLTLARSSGTTTVQFGASQTQDLPTGYRHFAFTVEGTGEIQSLQVEPAGGATALRRAPKRTAAARRTALVSAASAGSLSAVEADGKLNLTWDATANPYVTVIHEGATRTTLAIRLTGGSAQLPLAAVPAGGRFLIRYSDGLNPVERTIVR